MKAVIYTRTSSITDRQTNDRQIADLTKYAEANGIEVVKVFNEKVSGAKRNEERAVLMACLEYAEVNRIDTILCSELSRFGRAIWEVLSGIKFCIDKKIDVFFQKENLHVLDGDGKVDGIMAIYVSCLSFCAEKERENIAYRLNSGRRLAIARGVRMGRKVGSVKTRQQKEEQYKDVIKCLRKGLSVSETFAICSQKGTKCSISTIKRVKKEFVG
ncbi:recombinase family protein [Marseilla massiliensis]|uniref:Recombinase family protein n=1 Tax=Marseilla massiliensis TaxID=1841864 RepID=A0A938WWW1_9BACT|nr:recombinase family protein [Marseilla massiliensis]MBM6674569.1 recombinase family protein [Marseilla massiliensis]